MIAKIDKYYFCYNPNLKRRLTYFRKGNELICLVDGHRIVHDFRAEEIENINSLKETVIRLNKLIKKKSGELSK